MGLYISGKKSFLYATAVLFLLCDISPLRGDTKILEGSMSFRFRVESGNPELLDGFFEYENNSNSQRIIERGETYILVENRVNLKPLDTAVPFPPGSRYEGADFEEYLDYSTSRKGIEVRSAGGELVKRDFVEKTPLNGVEIDYLRRTALEITKGAKYQHEAVERVMRYIRETVGYTLQSSSNPVEVLRTGRAYCEGYANTGALLLRILGIPAKVVDSYIPPGHMWGYGQEGGGGFHAHVEVYYEDAGWISYDPQGTVHFVDPFHIVEYPRERTRLIQLSERDESRITDILAEPVDWDNFFQRDTTPGRNAPVFVGTIRDSSGEAVVDSFRSNAWVYLRKKDGGGEGVRILPTGEFALAPSTLERKDVAEPPAFFFRDGKGGWIEEELRFHGRDFTKKFYPLDDPRSVVFLNLRKKPAGLDRKGAVLYLWYPSASGGWRLDAVEGDGNGRIRLISSGGQWIAGTERVETAPKYRLDASMLEAGREYFIEELPRYLDPDLVYIDIVLPEGEHFGSEAGGAGGALESGGGEGSKKAYPELTFMNISSARRYQALSLDPRAMPLTLPDPDFSSLVLTGKALIVFTRIGSSLPPGQVSTVNLGQNTSFFDVYTPGADYPAYLAVMKGRRFSEIARIRSGENGRFRLYVEKGLLAGEKGELYLLHGTPVGSKRLMLTGLDGGSVRLDR
jgi:hypothetical protein